MRWRMGGRWREGAGRGKWQAGRGGQGKGKRTRLGKEIWRLVGASLGALRTRVDYCNDFRFLVHFLSRMCVVGSCRAMSHPLLRRSGIASTRNVGKGNEESPVPWFPPPGMCTAGLSPTSFMRPELAAFLHSHQVHSVPPRRTSVLPGSPFLLTGQRPAGDPQETTRKRSGLATRCLGDRRRRVPGAGMRTRLAKSLPAGVNKWVRAGGACSASVVPACIPGLNNGAAQARYNTE